MAEKAKNFVSAVIYLGEEPGCAAPFLEKLLAEFAARFEQYELVFVDDAGRGTTVQEVRDALAALPGEAPVPVTMVHMSLKQGLELAMNAGLDMAIGDFVYEFDSMKMPYPAELIGQAYETSLAGNDIVSVSPRKNRSATSSLFYRMFNSASGTKYKLHTDVFRLLTRRAINRVHSISAALPYRKAAYAASGLKLATIEFAGDAGSLKEHLRLTRAVDSLALYTNLAYKISFGISLGMLLLMVASLVYTLVNFLGGHTLAEGWTTLMLLLTGGFFGVFLILAIVLKYLSLVVDLIFKKQKYLVESVEKIS